MIICLMTFELRSIFEFEGCEATPFGRRKSRRSDALFLSASRRLGLRAHQQLDDLRHLAGDAGTPSNGAFRRYGRSLGLVLLLVIKTSWSSQGDW